MELLRRPSFDQQHPFAAGHVDTLLQQLAAPANNSSDQNSTGLSRRVFSVILLFHVARARLTSVVSLTGLFSPPCSTRFPSSPPRRSSSSSLSSSSFRRSGSSHGLVDSPTNPSPLQRPLSSSRASPVRSRRSRDSDTSSAAADGESSFLPSSSSSLWSRWRSSPSYRLSKTRARPRRSRFGAWSPVSATLSSSPYSRSLFDPPSSRPRRKHSRHISTPSCSSVWSFSFHLVLSLC